ncbi:MAG: hypothetical protein AAF183_17905 [Pseudomonadota bacterium]
MTTSVFFDINARDQSAAAFGAATGGLDRTTAATTRLSTAMTLSNRSARTFGSTFQGLGRSLSRGGNLVDALSGRLSQLLGVFGPLGFVIGGVAGGLLSFGDNAEDAAVDVGTLEGAVSDLEGVQRSYAEAVANTATVQGQATSSIIASTKREFEAKKSLLDLEIRRQKAALAAQRAEIEGTIQDVAANARRAQSARDRAGSATGPAALASQDQRRLADGFAADARAGLDTLQRLNAEATLAEEAIRRAEDALNTRFTDIGGGGSGAAGRQRALSSAMKETTEAAREQQVTFATLAETQRLVDGVNAEITKTLDDQQRQQQQLNRDISTFSDGLLRIATSAGSATEKLKALGLQLLSEGLRGLFQGQGAFSFLGGDGGIFGGFRETGGPVQAGRAYVVGERRPELFVPNQSGTIVPRVPEMTGSGGGSIAIGGTTINISQPGASPAQIEQIVARNNREMVRQLRQKQLRNPGFLPA